MPVTTEVLAFCRLALADVLAIAAVAKQVDVGGPSRTQPALTGGPLRATEIVVAVALLNGTTARWGILGATLLALGFLGALVHSMGRGSGEPCGCFGGLDREVPPLVSLFRASVLFALAGWVLAESMNAPTSPDVWSWIRDMDTTERGTTLLRASLIVVPLAVPGRLIALSRVVTSRLARGPSVRRPLYSRAAGALLATRSVPARDESGMSAPAAVAGCAPCGH